MIQHTSPISGIASYQTTYVATAGYDNRVILWNALKGEALACGYHDHLANQCQFSPCGNYLLSTSSDYSARLWELPTMRLKSIFTDHSDDVESAAFNPCLNYIATASRDKMVRVFDYQGRLLYKFSGHEKDVISVEWLNAEEMLSSSDDGTIRKWSIRKGEMIEKITLNAVETDTLAISREGIIFAGNDAGQIIIVRGKNLHTLSAHRAGIKRLCYSKEKNRLVSLSYDRSLMLWEISAQGNLTLKTRAQLPNIVWARSCAFLGDDYLVFATFGTGYATFNYHNGTWQTNRIQATPGINAVVYADTSLYRVGDAGIVYKDAVIQARLPGLCNFLTSFGNLLITGGQSGEICNAITGEVIYQHTSPLNCATQYKKQDGTYAIIGTYTGEGIVLKLKKNRPIYLTRIRLHHNAVKGMAANDKYIFSVCANNAAAFHRIEDLSLVSYRENAHDKIANACAALDTQFFISVSRDLKMRIFDVDFIKTIPTPHKNSIKCITSIHNGRYVATGDYTGNIIIYKNLTEPYLQARPTQAGISCIAAKPDGKGIVAASYDGNLYTIDF